MKRMWIAGLFVFGAGCQAICGDQVTEEAEACDDGNTLDGDGCDAGCRVEKCGDGLTNNGEACDDGNTTNGDGCNNDCSLPSCGNGIVEPGEFCLAASSIAVDSAFVLAVGDFNEDARPDIATANQSSDTLSVLLGDGLGGFAPAETFAVGSGPSSLVVGDFNNDGNQDLAAATLFSVDVLLGDGSGGFGAVAAFAAGGRFSLVVSDFDNDGNQDLAVRDGVLLGDGLGSFGALLALPVENLQSIAAGDFNNDGNQDLVGVNPSEGVNLLLGDGLGSFGLPVLFLTGGFPSALEAEDLNADGSLDLAVLDLVGDTVRVLLGDGLGSFGPGQGSPTQGPGPNSMALADLNDDGFLDLAVTHTGTNEPSRMNVLFGDGTGDFSPPRIFFPDSFPDSIQAADFNLDGHPDLALTTFTDVSQVTLFLFAP